MTEKFFNPIARHPLLTTVLILGICLLASMGVKHLTFNDSYRAFISEDDTHMLEYDAIQDTYGKNDQTVILVFQPEGGDAFSQNTLEAMHWTTEKAWQLSFSSRVDSLTNYQHTTVEGDDLIVEDLVYDPALLTEQNRANIKAIATREPTLVNRLVSPSGHVAAINITYLLGPEETLSERREIVMGEARALAKEIEQQFPEITVYVSGFIPMNYSFVEVSAADFGQLFPITIAVVFLVLLVTLRNVGSILAILVVVIVSIASALGSAGWYGMVMSGPSVNAPIIILTLGIADCVHILTSYFHNLRQGMEKKHAIVDSVTFNLRPIFLTTLTTAIGFMSMRFSESPPFHDLGDLVAIGVTIALVLSLTLFPAILMLLPVPRQSDKAGENRGMQAISSLIIKYQTSLLAATLVLVAFMGYAASKNQFNDSFHEYFADEYPYRIASKFMQENLTGAEAIEISIDSKVPGGMNDPEFLNTLDNLNQWLLKLPFVEHVHSITDVMKRLNKNMHGDDPAYYRIPGQRDLSAQYLLLYEMSLPYGLDLNNQINIEKSSTRILVSHQQISAQQLIGFEADVKQWFVENAPSYEIAMSSPTLAFTHTSLKNSKTMMKGTTLALILVIFVVGIALRSLRFGLVSIIPTIAPAVIGFGVWYFIEGYIGLGISIVAGMTLGIVVDYSVHTLSKYQHAREHKGLNSEESIRYVFGSVGPALWITTLALVIGFSVLSFSSFTLNADLGLLTAITITVALLIDFMFLPSLLMKLDTKKPEKPAATAQGELS